MHAFLSIWSFRFEVGGKNEDERAHPTEGFKLRSDVREVKSCSDDIDFKSTSGV